MATNKTNSKKKGNKWERDVCKFFKEWSGYEFSRVPASGGLRWHKKDDIVSDVICTDEKHGRRFCFNLECKFYKDLKFEHILLGNDSCKILHFWEQTKSDSKRANKIPMLIMRYNNMPKMEAFVMMEKSFFNLILNSEMGIKFKQPMMAIRTNSDEAFYIFMLSDLKNLEYNEFYKMGRKFLKESKSA